VTARTRYAPELRQFLEQLDREGLTPVVRSARAVTIEQVFRLVEMGVVSSSSRRLGVGEDFWRLHFRRRGRSLRKLLAAEAARA
jgi:hypothetical protein